jgi:hypothetical protein
MPDARINRLLTSTGLSSAVRTESMTFHDVMALLCAGFVQLFILLLTLNGSRPNPSAQTPARAPAQIEDATPPLQSLGSPDHD